MTATFDSVGVCDSNDGHLLMQIRIKVTPSLNTGLLWSNKYLFIISDSKINQFEASTGSPGSEWPAPDINHTSCIALPEHGDFIAHSTKRTVMFHGTSAHTWVGLIQHPQDIYSIALSPDDQFLALSGNSGKIAIKNLRDILPASYSTVSILYCRFRSVRHAS